MTVERIKMPFGNWSDLDNNPKVNVALNTERRDKAGPSVGCQTMKPLTCLWDFEGTVLLTSHSCIFSTGSMAAFTLSLPLETHPMKQQQEDQRKSMHWTDASAWEGGWNSKLGLLKAKMVQGLLRFLIWLGQLETLLPLTRGKVYSSHGREVVTTPTSLFPSLHGLLWTLLLRQLWHGNGTKHTGR